MTLIRNKTILCLTLTLPLSLPAETTLPPAAKMQVDFNKHVEPILAGDEALGPSRVQRRV